MTTEQERERADDEREVQVAKARQWNAEHPVHDRTILIEALDAARLALSTAQKDVELRDKEIAELTALVKRQAVSIANTFGERGPADDPTAECIHGIHPDQCSTCTPRLRAPPSGHLNDFPERAEAPPGADAMEIAELKRVCWGRFVSEAELDALLNKIIKAAEARGRAKAIEDVAGVAAAACRRAEAALGKATNSDAASCRLSAANAANAIERDIRALATKEPD